MDNVLPLINLLSHDEINIVPINFKLMQTAPKSIVARLVESPIHQTKTHLLKRPQKFVSKIACGVK